MGGQDHQFGTSVHSLSLPPLPHCPCTVLLPSLTTPGSPGAGLGGVGGLGGIGGAGGVGGLGGVGGVGGLGVSTGMVATLESSR